MQKGQQPTGSRVVEPCALFAEAPELNTRGRRMEHNHDMIRDIAADDVSVIFFSKTNIDALNEGMRELVYLNTNREQLIGPQSEQTLQTIMRAMFYQNAQHRPYGILSQVRALNQAVLDYCVPNIIGALSMRKYYLKDIDRLPQPQARGEFVSSKGTRVLELKQF